MDRVKTGVLAGLGISTFFILLLAIFSYNPYQFLAFILETSKQYLLMGAAAVLATGVSFGSAFTYLLERFANQAKVSLVLPISAVVFTLSFFLTFATVSFNIFSYISMNGFLYTLASMTLLGATLPSLSFLLLRLADSLKLAVSGSGGIASLILSLGCPSCGSLVFSLIGVSAGLSLLPFKGLELKILSFAAVYYSISKLLPNPDIKVRFAEQAKPISMGIRALLVAVAIAFLLNTGMVLGMLPQKVAISADISSLKSTAQTLEAVFPELKAAASAEEISRILLPSGIPDYSAKLGGITYDDPVSALNYLTSIYTQMKREIKADREKWERYINLAAAPRGISCEFCCGVGPQGITKSGDLRCGCSHNVALQSLTMGLIMYTDYTDAEILREVMIWKAKFFPGPMVQLASSVSSGDADLSNLPGMVGGC